MPVVRDFEYLSSRSGLAGLLPCRRAGRIYEHVEAAREARAGARLLTSHAAPSRPCGRVGSLSPRSARHLLHRRGSGPLASTTGDDSRVDRCGSVTTRQPLDPRREAFAKAVGHLLAEAVWTEIVEAAPQDINQGGDAAPPNDDARRAGRRRASAVEVDRERLQAPTVRRKRGSKGPAAHDASRV